MKFPGIFVIVAIGICVGSHFLFPQVYVVSDCGVYTEAVLIFPQERNGTKMTLGKKVWISNESDKYLYLESVRYGYGSSRGRSADTSIEPYTCIGVPIGRINYLFEEPPQSISTESSSGETRYWLDCDYD